MKTTIDLWGGMKFDFCRIDCSPVRIETIAHSLSQICRFTGHTRHHYSVAQHSVLVSKLVDVDIALEGLMHDAAECLIGDVSSPLKSLLPDYKQIERVVESELFSHLGIDMAKHKLAVKVADRLAGDVEHALLVCEKGQAQENLEILRQSLGEDLISMCVYAVRQMSCEDAKAEFMRRYVELHPMPRLKLAAA